VSRHKTLVGTEIVLVLGLVGFVAAMVGVEHTAPGPARLGPLAALGFAAVPSVLWLGYFYLQDRNEPEDNRQLAEDRDPLGRSEGNFGNAIDNGTNKVPTEPEMQRSREIMDELRRRAGEADRPQQELDYIDRLLRRF